MREYADKMYQYSSSYVFNSHDLWQRKSTVYQAVATKTYQDKFIVGVCLFMGFVDHNKKEKHTTFILSKHNHWVYTTCHFQAVL